MPGKNKNHRFQYESSCIRALSDVTCSISYFKMVNMTYTTGHIPRLLTQMGMVPYDAPTHVPASECYTVALDGKMIGWLSASMAPSVAEQLRGMKVKGLNKVSWIIELFALSV